jgi:hypothetical protein
LRKAIMNGWRGGWRNASHPVQFTLEATKARVMEA